jgi:hypothetical protein
MIFIAEHFRLASFLADAGKQACLLFLTAELKVTAENKLLHWMFIHAAKATGHNKAGSQFRFLTHFNLHQFWVHVVTLPEFQ